MSDKIVHNGHHSHMISTISIKNIKTKSQINNSQQYILLSSYSSKI